ncbi:MAG: ribosome-associated translation inhibitor RaiA [Actinobacteria bacterium]|nr:MAG: ribosome-associated translation inhibitor RaiA [Actinomycetota bacterium]
MDLVLKGRGTDITEHDRRAAERRLSRVPRFDRRVERVEVEVILEHNPRVGAEASHRVEITCHTKRRQVRAHGAGPDVDSALDQAARRLERQLSTYRSKLRDRLTRRRRGVESPRTSPQGSSSSE